MKTYIKPTIDFIELKSEERLACGSNGCCPGNIIDIRLTYIGKYLCKQTPLGCLCDFISWLN